MPSYATHTISKQAISCIFVLQLTRSDMYFLMILKYKDLQLTSWSYIFIVMRQSQPIVSVDYIL